MAADVQHFSTAPQAVRTRKKYREPADQAPTKNNLMHDKRVARGSTFASSVVTPQEDMAEVQRQREAQRRRLMRAAEAKKRAGTPEPVVGRKHMDIQTDKFLEELTERTVEFEAETQTDFLLDRPPSPLFMPAKIGTDAETQIEDGELFDFDVECDHVLEVLVGKTLEQSMMEVLEEEELESLRRHQEDFEKRRNVELLEVQRMEAAEKRRHEEMTRRVQQQAAQRDQDVSSMKKVVSRSIASAHLFSLKKRAMGHLRDAGCFYDETKLDVDNFMPRFMDMVTKQMHQSSQHKAALENIVRSAVGEQTSKHKQKLDGERLRLKHLDDAERQARLEIDAHRQAAREDAARLEAERAQIQEWEAYQPPPPPPPTLTDFDVSALRDDESVAVLADSREAQLSEDQLASLRQQLEEAGFATTEDFWAQADKRLVASVVDGPPDEPPVIESFRIEGTRADDDPGSPGAPDA